MCVTRKLSAFLLVDLYTVYTVIMRHSCRYIVYQPDQFFSCVGDRLGFIHSCVVEQVTWGHHEPGVHPVAVEVCIALTVRTSYCQN